MNELSQSVKQLPDTLPDLSRFVLIGRAQLKAVRDAIKHIDKIGVAKEVHEQKLREAQEIAEAVLDAEVKIGELTSRMEKAQGFASTIKDNGVPNVTKQKQLEEIGITEKQKQRFEALAKHPEIVEQAKADARENDRIVTRQDALNRIAPPQSHQQTMKEIEKKARAEHQEFKEKKKDSVVSFEDIQRDKRSQNIINHSIKSGIMGAIKAISNISFLNASEVNEMVETSTKEDLEWMRNALLNSIETLSFLYHKFGG